MLPRANQEHPIVRRLGDWREAAPASKKITSNRFLLARDQVPPLDLNAGRLTERLVVLGYFLGEQRLQYLVPVLVALRIALALGDQAASSRRLSPLSGRNVTHCPVQISATGSGKGPVGRWRRVQAIASARVAVSILRIGQRMIAGSFVHSPLRLLPADLKYARSDLFVVLRVLSALIWSTLVCCRRQALPERCYSSPTECDDRSQGIACAPTPLPLSSPDAS